MIWVHDYHLMSLAAELRALGANQKIGFFLHIPFPPPEMLLAVPLHDWLLEVLFQFDVLGFQTSTDTNNFRRCVCKYAEGQVHDDGRIEAFGRTVLALEFPISIDVDEFAAMANTPKASVQIARLNHRTVVRSHIICWGPP